MIAKSYVLGKFNKDKNSRRIMDQGTGETMLTSYERDAQIHAMMQLYREYKDVWDTLSWNDLLDLGVGIRSFYERIDVKKKKIFKKNFLKRMHREGILGKRMR